jgi:pyridoxamine 5'-phosphate oxidase
VIEPDEPLVEGSVDPDPVVQFGRWFEQAAAVMDAPEAMALATADRQGRPSVRMVLLKAWGPDGFVFFTNYGSRKGAELADNPRASLLFHWESTGRQVRITGDVERTSPAVSDEYFASRPVGSQLGARASQQSAVVADRSVLESRMQDLADRYQGQPVPRPAWWGGFRVVPDSFEFWQHRHNRLHDRLRYLPDGRGWRLDRLQP